MNCLFNKKSISMIIICCIYHLFSYGQKTEINLNAYTGLFSFHGSGSTSTSWLNLHSYSLPSDYTANVYGRKGDLSYSFELQMQRISKSRNIYGAGISFEALTSKVDIDTITSNGFVYYVYAAKGKTTLRNTLITFNPFVGHRYIAGKFLFDLSAGVDLGICLKSHEKGEATRNNVNYYTKVENNKPKPLIDVRPRLQVKVQYKKIGLIVGYSLGVTNFQNELNGKAYTGFLRLGAGFQIK